MIDNIKKDKSLNRLVKFLKIPSVSGNPKYKKDILQAVKFLKQELLEAGFSRTKIEELYGKKLNFASNNPVIYAERLNLPEAPTILIYGHYDVQPPEPLNEWTTKPFEPSIRDEKIYARGATDDKGQLYTHIAALKILNSEWSKVWPVNIKIIIEGEEECGGGNIEKLIKENPQKFKADLCLISDTQFADKKTPAIEAGLRGIAYFEMEIVTAEKDLHSGLFGGAVRNPINIISNIMTKLEVRFGQSKLKKVPLNAECMSFDIHGVCGGFQDEGAKTVIPNRASVKFSIRTTPGQSIEKIAKEVLSFIKKNSPRDVEVDLNILHVGEGFLANTKSKYMELANESLKKVFGKAPIFTKSGGSIPAVSVISKVLGMEVILMGYGFPDDGLHSPNEKFDLKQFYEGIDCNMEFLKALSESN